MHSHEVTEREFESFFQASDLIWTDIHCVVPEAKLVLSENERISWSKLKGVVWIPQADK